jgi:hypothetical protein
MGTGGSSSGIHSSGISRTPMGARRASVGPTGRRRTARWNRASRTVKRSFVLGRQLPAWDALNPSAQEWVLTVADQRRHGTIFRKPAEAFGEERLRSHDSQPPLPPRHGVVSEGRPRWPGHVGDPSLLGATGLCRTDRRGPFESSGGDPDLSSGDPHRHPSAGPWPASGGRRSPHASPGLGRPLPTRAPSP